MQILLVTLEISDLISFFRSVEKHVLELTKTKRQLPRKPSGEEHSDQSPPTKDVKESEKTGTESDGKNEPELLSTDESGALEKPVENPTGDDKETKSSSLTTNKSSISHPKVIDILDNQLEQL